MSDLILQQDSQMTARYSLMCLSRLTNCTSSRARGRYLHSVLTAASIDSSAEPIPRPSKQTTISGTSLTRKYSLYRNSARAIRFAKHFDQDPVPQNDCSTRVILGNERMGDKINWDKLAVELGPDSYDIQEFSNIKFRGDGIKCVHGSS